MEKLISWLTVMSAITVEKVLGGLFYYGFYRYLLSTLDVFSACMEMFLIQLIIAIPFVYVYDSAHKDIFGIVIIRHKLKTGHAFERWPKVAAISRWITTFLFGHDSPITSFLFRMLTFVILAIQFAPPIPVLCVRGDRVRGIRLQEAVLLLINVTFTTAYWAGFHLGILDPIINWFKN